VQRGNWKQEKVGIWSQSIAAAWCGSWGWTSALASPCSHVFLGRIFLPVWLAVDKHMISKRRSPARVQMQILPARHDFSPYQGFVEVTGIN